MTLTIDPFWIGYISGVGVMMAGLTIGHIVKHWVGR